MSVCLSRADMGGSRLLVWSGCLESVFFWDKGDGAWMQGE